MRLSTMQNDPDDRFVKEQRFETLKYWLVRSRDIRSQAEQMVAPETRRLMLGLAGDYERMAHIVEGMASIHGDLASVMASLNGLLSEQSLRNATAASATLPGA
jgi:hypothetical protein